MQWMQRCWGLYFFQMSQNRVCIRSVFEKKNRSLWGLYFCQHRSFWKNGSTGEGSEVEFQHPTKSFPNLSILSVSKSSEITFKKHRPEDFNFRTLFEEDWWCGGYKPYWFSTAVNKKVKEKDSRQRSSTMKLNRLKIFYHISISKSEGGKDSTPKSSLKVFRNQRERKIRT